MGVTVSFDINSKGELRTPLKIIAVEEGSIAETSGLKVGWYIYSVKGNQAIGNPYYKTFDIFESYTEGDKVTVSPNSDGTGIVEVVLTKTKKYNPFESNGGITSLDDFVARCEKEIAEMQQKGGLILLESEKGKISASFNASVKSDKVYFAKIFIWAPADTYTNIVFQDSFMPADNNPVKVATSLPGVTAYDVADLKFVMGSASGKVRCDYNAGKGVFIAFFQKP